MYNGAYIQSICDQYHTVEGGWKTTEESGGHSESNMLYNNMLMCAVSILISLCIPLYLRTWVMVQTYVVQCWYASGVLANSYAHCLCVPYLVAAPRGVHSNS